MRQLVIINPSYMYSIDTDSDDSDSDDSQNKSVVLDSTSIYKYHDTYEPQIPPHISIICVATAHLYLIPGILFIYCKQPLVMLFGCSLIALYISSITHWRYPMFDSYIHYIDIFLVIENSLYATCILYTFSTTVFTIWMVNVSFALPIFIMNEILYYYQVKIPKNILRNDPDFKPTKNSNSNLTLTLTPILDSNDSKDSSVWCKYFQNYFSLEPTWPNTPEREYAYYRSVITHAIFIHGLTGGIAAISIALIILLYYQ